MRKSIMVLVAGCSVVATACGSSGGGSPTPSYARATDLPARRVPAADGSTVAAGSWGIVKANRDGSSPNTFAVRVTDVAAGSAGALKDVQSLNGAASVDLAKATPYFVSVDFVTLSGKKLGDVNMNLYGASATGSQSGFATLSLPSNLEKCKVADDGGYADAYGKIMHRCIAVAAAGGRPSRLVFDDPRGSANVRFALPAR